MSECPRKPPEAPGSAPEVGPEAPGSRWLTMPEVATLVGVSERAARDWVKRHDLLVSAGRPVRVAEAFVLAQLVAEGREPRKPPEDSPEAPGSPSEGPGRGEPIEAAYTSADTPAVALVPLAGVADQLQAFADRLAELAARNEGLALEVGQLRERSAGHEAQLAAKDETIAAKDQTLALQQDILTELRRRAAHAERERDALREEMRAQAAPQPPSEAPTILVMQETPNAPAPAGGFWQRVRRALGGE